MPTILLVEDNELNRDMLSRRLERLGHRVGLAADGLEALEAVSAEAYDLILLDLWMPKLDGVGVLERLQPARVTEPTERIRGRTDLLAIHSAADRAHPGMPTDRHVRPRDRTPICRD
jgi:CheY-like chemotaxis protein